VSFKFILKGKQDSYVGQGVGDNLDILHYLKFNSKEDAEFYLGNEFEDWEILEEKQDEH